MFLLTLETEHFHFQAVGNTEAEAREALDKGTRVHAEQYDLEPIWIEGYDVRVQEINAGECHRDYSMIYQDPSE